LAPAPSTASGMAAAPPAALLAEASPSACRWGEQQDQGGGHGGACMVRARCAVLVGGLRRPLRAGGERVFRAILYL